MRKSVLTCLGLLVAGSAAWAQYLITTVAGNGLPATAAPARSTALPLPWSMAVDGFGNYYFSAANAVFKVDGAGVLTRVAGSTAAGFSGDGGAATSARLDAPQGIAVDGSGNVYIADTGNHRIRKVAATGIITTVAGIGTPGYSGNGGPATSAQLNLPYGVAVDSIGALFIADTGNSRIRKVAAATGVISTVAGSAFHSGNFGDGGPAIAAQLQNPHGVAVDASGNFYIADTSNNTIRKVTASNGIITTVAGTSAPGYTGDGGAATSATLYHPTAVVVDSAGELFIADSVNNVIREVGATGSIITVAGNGTFGYTGDGGAAGSAELAFPNGVARDAAGNLYVADTSNAVIRLVVGGTISTVGGSGAQYLGDGGPANDATFQTVIGAALDSAGNLYVSDAGSNVVRKIAGGGTITTVAGNGTPGYTGDGGAALSAELNTPAGLALDGAGNLYIADSGNNVIRKVTAAGIISTVAGNGTAGYSGNGAAATSAELSGPTGVAVDASGNIFIADTVNLAVRQVTTIGNIRTIAGGNGLGHTGDGGLATACTLNTPQGVAVDSSGAVYIADTGNSAIRKVANGNITAFAGSATGGYSGDGGLATDAQLQNPYGVVVDASGNVYIADTGNQAIRLVASNGGITTIAGKPGFGYAGDGGAATDAQLTLPRAVAVDSAGGVYLTDQSVVRLLVPLANRPLLNVTQTQTSAFTQGQSGTYSVVVGNFPATVATSGTVTVTESFPASLALVSMSGSGWNCAGSSCSRSDALSPGSSYPAITVTVNVSGSAAGQVTNQVTVTGGGSPSASVTGTAAISAGPLMPPALVSPANGVTGVTLTPALTWSGSGATNFQVYLGTIATPPLVTTTTGSSYTPAALNPSTKYYWQVVAQNGTGSAASETWSFTTGATAPTALRFVPVTPCRVADTRNPAGTFGGPVMAGGTARSFPVPQSACGIPATAQAYSLNVTVVPQGTLSYLTLWPAGLAQPLVSTLNSFGGTVVANAAIVPAGVGGAVSVFVSNQTDVVLDINGYFDSTAATSYSFYPAQPCRVADTRNPVGLFGGPSMSPGQTRGFPIPSGGCNISSGATAYSLNVTVVPGTDYLAYLSTWPTGQPQPLVSTLNSWEGQIVANAALVPAGSNGSVSVFVTDPTDVVLDINGYFGQPGSAGALSFYPIAPCRVADTRNATGPFGGPEMEAASVRTFPIPASSCYVPTTAVAYSLNVTVVPDGPLSYLTAWPAGSGQPFVSTLNSLAGEVVANAAIVPAGTGGAISVFVTNRTHVILDINGYFAP